DRLRALGEVSSKLIHELRAYSTSPEQRKLLQKQWRIGEVAKLLGISESSLQTQPTLSEVIPQLRHYLGDATLIAHNAQFDRAFMEKAGFRNHHWLDTLELGSILLPRALRYSLAYLSSHFQIDLVSHHRATDDARATAYLYWELWKVCTQLPPALIQEILTHSKDLKWETRPYFEAALAESKATYAGPKTAPPSVVPITPASPAPADTPPIDGDIYTIFGEQGLLSQKLAGHEYRPQQQDMAAQVDAVLRESKQVIIEAGTGVGKTLAYLIPAAIWSREPDRRVVISTYTTNLQDQLIQNDIPMVSAALGQPINAVVLKGRSHYLCPRRLEDMRRSGPTTLDELRILAKVLIWQQTPNSGDRNEINLRGFNELAIWNRLSADEHACTVEDCETLAGGRCPLFQSRKAAQSAQIVIVNHALLCADPIGKDPILPPYNDLIVDEAHNLEDAATSAYAVRLDEAGVAYRISELSSIHRSLLGDVLAQMKDSLTAEDYARLSTFGDHISQGAKALRRHIDLYFEAVRAFIGDMSGDSADGPATVRLTPKTRQSAAFQRLHQTWTPVEEFLSGIVDAVRKLADGLRRWSKKGVRNAPDLLRRVESSLDGLSRLQAALSDVMQPAGSDTIHWFNQSYGGNISIQTAPLTVGPALRQNLWQQKRSVVLTSATLRSDADFGYLQERLQAESMVTVALDSPFDYRQNCLIYLPNDLPDPNERGAYQQAIERSLVELAAALDGRTLALFTSYGQLQQTAQAVRPRLALGSIAVYDQVEASNRMATLEGFKSAEKAVLMGTRGFWEGIDIPGVALSALMMTRLPFPVPNDPVIAARSDTFNDSFRDYMLPEAILRFRQGFGRLIRSKSDRGIVVILDKRITSKAYGAQFLAALPPCTIQHGSLQSVSQAAMNWLSRPGLGSPQP
ncbi:MAG: DEAD/DEAH box helicase, partial [Anaerolineae bacterium]|nr:DEAD/DEAH box helicase [Anaerolineae bacterium]